MAEFDKQILNELQGIQGFLVNSIAVTLSQISESLNEGVTELLSLSEYLKEGKKAKEKPKEGKIIGKGASEMKGGLFKDIIKDLKDMSTVVPGFASAMKKFDKIDTVKFTTFWADLTKALTREGEIKKPKDLSDLYEAISKVFESFGKNITKFAKGLILFSLADKLKGPQRFKDFVEKFFKKSFMKKIDPVPAIKAGRALQSLGSGIMKFAGALALATPLLIIGIPGALLLIPVILGIMGVMRIISKMGIRVFLASMAMNRISKAFLFFAVSLIAMRLVRPKDVLMSIAVIGVFTLFVAAMVLVGKLGGLGGLTKVSVGIMALSAAFGLFGLSMLAFKLLDLADIGKAALSLLVLSGVVILFALTSAISMKGVLMFGLMAVTFGIIGLTMLVFKLISWEDIGKMAVIIGGLGVFMAALGAAAAVTIVGVGVFVAMGIGLALFAIPFVAFIFSLALFKASGWCKDDTENLTGVITGLLIGVGQAFRGKGFLGGLKTFVTGAAGTGLLGALGLALLPFTYGLSIFMKSKATVDDAERLGDIMSALITRIQEPLEEIGKTGGFLRRTDFRRGLMSVRGLGKIMSDLAKGVQEMSNLTFTEIKEDGTKGELIKLTTKHFFKAALNIGLILHVVRIPIENIGKTGGFMQRTDFKKGLKSVRGLGGFMVELARGIKDMSKLTFTETKDDGTTIKVPLKPADFTKVGRNIWRVLAAVYKPIAGIGKTGGFMKRPAFKIGLKSVRDLGGFMVDLAQGVKEMTNLTFTEIDEKGKKGKPVTIGKADFKIVGENITAIINAVKDPIADIGARNVLMPIGKSDFARGLIGIKGLGKEIINLSKSVDEALKIQEKKVDYLDLSVTLASMFKSLIDPFAWVAKKIPDFSGIHNTADDVIKLSKKMRDISKIIDKSYTKKKVTHFDTITKNIVTIAKQKDPLRHVALSIGSISKNLIKLFEGVNLVSVKKYEKVTDYWDSLIEFDKIDAAYFEKKINLVQELIDKTGEIKPKEPIEIIEKVEEITEVKAEKIKEAGLEKRVELLENVLIKLSESTEITNGLLTDIDKKLRGTIRVNTGEGGFMVGETY